MRLRRISNQILRAFALVVTARRWAAPLTATALGFGLFIGVAIGPSAAGTMAGQAPVLALSSPVAEKGEAQQGEGRSAGGGGALGGASSGGGGASEGGGALGALPAPLASEPALEPVPPAEEEVPAEAAPKTPAGGEAEEEAGEGEEATELRGAVAAVNEAAGSYALAVKGGELVPVHARELPAPGAKLTVTGARLANGSFAAEEMPKRAGKAAEVSFRGAVTFVDPDPADPAYTVSGRGASLLVHVPPDPSGAVPVLPVAGAYVSVTTGFEQRASAVDPAAPPLDVLVQRELEVEPGEPTTYLDLAGIVKQVLPETAQLLLSADGSGESEKDLTLSVPAEIKLAKLTAGDSYLATATVNPDGTLALAGIASDEHLKGADDAATAQGDLKR